MPPVDMRPSSSQSSLGSLAGSADDHLFAFPQPPTRLESKESLLSRPSLPALRTAYKYPTARDVIAKRPSVPHRDLANLASHLSPSSSATLDGSYNWDYYSPAISDANSADTDHSSVSLAPSLSSDAETHGPLTPGTPSSSGSGWRPKELNLLRRRERAISGEGSMPIYQTSRSWQTNSGAASGERAQLMVGLGITPITPITPTSAGLPLHRHAKSARTRSSAGASAGAGGPVSAGPGGPPKGLLLSGSASLPTTRRFQGPAGRSRESSFGSASGNNDAAKVRASPIPVLPSTPAFMSLPPEGFDSQPSTRTNSITAEEFVARVASQSESHLLWAGRGDAAWEGGLSADWRKAPTAFDPDHPPLSAVSTMAFDHHGDEDQDEDEAVSGSSEHATRLRERSSSFASPALGTVSSGFSHAAALSSSKRKAPPARLVLGVSPEDSRDQFLPPALSTLSASAKHEAAEGSKSGKAVSVPASAAPSIDRELSDVPSGQVPAAAGPSAARSTEGGPNVSQAGDDNEEALKTAFFDFEQSDASSEEDSLDITPPARTKVAVAQSQTGAAQLSPASAALASGNVTTEAAATADAVLASPVRAPQSSKANEDSAMGFLQREQAKGVPAELLDPVSPKGARPAATDGARPVSEATTDDALQAAELEDQLERLPGEAGDIQDSWSTSKSLSRLSMWMQQPESRTAFRVSIFAPGATSPTEVRSRNLADIFVDPKDTSGSSPAAASAAVTQYAAAPPPDARPMDSPTDPTYRKEGTDHRLTQLHRMLDEAQADVDAESGRRILAQEPRSESIDPQSTRMAPRRKPSLVPPPPQFAINTLPAMSSGIASAPATMALDQHPAAFGPQHRGNAGTEPGLSSRWSSGSESESGSVASAKSVRRKSSSKGGKKLSLTTKRKSNSAASGRDSMGRSALSSPALSDAQSNFGSMPRSRLSSQTGPKSPAIGTGGKRSFLSSLTGTKRKEIPEAWKAAASVSGASTPGSNGQTGPSPSIEDRHGFPFPRVEAPVPIGVVTPLPDAQLHVHGSTMTTQQILEQARNNVWPDRVGGRTIRGPALREQVSVPVLHQDRDTYRAALQLKHKPGDDLEAAGSAPATMPSSPVTRSGFALGPRTAPASPRPSTSTTRDVLNEVNELDRSRASMQSVHKKLPRLPPLHTERLTNVGDADEPRSSVSRERSSQRLQRMADSVPTPRNLRHARQGSAVPSPALSQRSEFDRAVMHDSRSKPPAAGLSDAESQRAADFAPSSEPLSSAEATPRVRIENLPSIRSESPEAHKMATGGDEPPSSVSTAAASAVSPQASLATSLKASAARIGRRRAKERKARSIKLFRDEWPHRTSLTDFGRAWLRSHGAEAIEALEREPNPHHLLAAGAAAVSQRGTGGGRRPRQGTAPSGSAGSDSGDTDDYGSSDGGGGGNCGDGGEHSGAGGAGNGRGNPDDGGDDDDDDDSSDGDDDGGRRNRASSDDEDEDDDLSTDDESEDDYGAAEDEEQLVARQARASQPANADDSDSSDDRPLGEMVQDPKALQRALREQERRKQIESSRSALENGPPRGTSQRTQRKLAAKASRQKAMMQFREAQPNAGESSEASVDVADLTRRLMRVQTRRNEAPPRSPVGDAGGHAFGMTSGTDSDHPLAALAASHGGLSRARSINRSAADDAAAMRSKSVRTRPSDAALQSRARAQAAAQGLGIGAPVLPGNAAATVAAAQKAMTAAQANPTPANRAHAKAMAAAANAAMGVLTRPQRSATMGGAVANDPGALPSLAGGGTSGGGANLTRHRTEIRPSGRGDGRHASHTIVSQGHAAANSHSSPTSPDDTLLQQQQQQQHLLHQGSSHEAAGAVSAGPLPFIGNRPRARSRAQAPTVNTAVAPPVPDLSRLVSPPLRSPSVSSPLTPNSANFAALAPHLMTDSTDTDVSKDGGPSTSNDDGNRRPSISAAIPPRVSSSSSASSPAMPAAALAHAAPVASLSTDSSYAAANPASHRARFKVFVMNKQRFTTTEIPPTARARELVLDVIEREQVPVDESKGGWVVFDCSPEYGIERPLREYEIVHEVADSRANVETDHFLLKRTELSPYLSIRAVPNSSPALAGYVYVQDKKKKWNKRWLELRDHALYQAKSEKGKDEAIICQMSNFDVYLVDAAKVKVPKAHAFALRSQDKITMFEKPDQDYIHYFSLSDPAAHRDWVRAIMNARTYILRQERAVLFRPPPVATSGAALSPSDGGGGGIGGGSTEAPAMGQTRSATSNGGLSRRNTSRRPPGGGGRGGGVSAAPAMPDQPLVSGIGAPLQPEAPAAQFSREAFTGPFEKGSLLADIAIKNASEAMRIASPMVTTYAAQEAKRREEAVERQRRLRTEGQPLVDLSKR